MTVFRKFAAVLLCTLAQTAGPAAAENNAPAMVSASENQPPAVFKATLDAGVPMVMLDVRTPAEWAEGIIEGAVMVNLPDLPTADGLAMLPADRTAAIGVYCRSGRRSAQALTLLHRLGYTNVINMTGGFDAWKAAEFPFVTPAN